MNVRAVGAFAVALMCSFASVEAQTPTSAASVASPAVTWLIGTWVGTQAAGPYGRYNATYTFAYQNGAIVWSRTLEHTSGFRATGQATVNGANVSMTGTVPATTEHQILYLTFSLHRQGKGHLVGTVHNQIARGSAHLDLTKQ